MPKPPPRCLSRHSVGMSPSARGHAAAPRLAPSRIFMRLSLAGFGSFVSAWVSPRPPSRVRGDEACRVPLNFGPRCLTAFAAPPSFGRSLASPLRQGPWPLLRPGSSPGNGLRFRSGHLAAPPSLLAAGSAPSLPGQLRFVFQLSYPWRPESPGHPRILRCLRCSVSPCVSSISSGSSLLVWDHGALRAIHRLRGLARDQD